MVIGIFAWFVGKFNTKIDERFKFINTRIDRYEQFGGFDSSCIFARMNAKFMNRCMDLALRGSGHAAPNPLVGCVIVHKNQIIGEGYHRKYGQAHAEVNAIASVKNPELLRESTLYVNLEPCAHYGKTPPCAHLIAEKGIKKVVVAMRDPFDAVNGKGIDILRQSGIEVIEDCEREAGEWLNRRFFTFHRNQRPYVILKFARSADGYIDRERKPGNRGVNWITAPETQYLTHTWRSEEAAILVGTQTALIDNPSLTVRKVKGPSPLRLLIDPILEVPGDAAIFSNDANTVVFNAAETSETQNVRRVQLDFNSDVVPQIMKWCYNQHIQSLLVEGGAHTLQSFVDQKIWDEARILTGTPVFGTGLPAPEINGHMREHYFSGPDEISILTQNP